MPSQHCLSSHLTPTQSLKRCLRKRALHILIGRALVKAANQQRAADADASLSSLGSVGVAVQAEAAGSGSGDGGSGGEAVVAASAAVGMAIAAKCAKGVEGLRADQVESQPQVSKQIATATGF